MNTPPCPAAVLLVDDKPANLLALEALIDLPEVEVVKATSGNQALGLLLERSFALVLMDVQMPEMDGFETATIMRSNERTQHVPIIFVTAISKDERYVFQGYRSGAVDYLTKPINPHILHSKISVFLELYRQRREIEAINRELRDAIKALEDSRTEVEAQNRVLVDLACRDGLTGLHNHRHFHEEISRALARANRHGAAVACVLMDLDHFKEVNDTCGHPFGDHVLQQFAAILAEEVRRDDLAARYGGEEFAVLLQKTNLGKALRVVERIRARAEETVYRSGDHSMQVTISAGIALFQPERPCLPRELIARADQALYRAKAAGRNRVVTADAGEA